MREWHDARRWDELVQTSPAATFLQSYAWGRQKQHFGWAPVRLQVAGPTATPLLAQVLFRRIPYTPYTLGYVPRGPIVDYANDEALDLLDRALSHLARRYRAVVITWEPPLPQDPLLTAQLTRHGLRPSRGVQARVTRLIDLQQGLEAVAAQQHQKWRYNTRLARKHGVTVREARTPVDVAAWYQLLQTTATRDGFAAHSEEYYQRFWQETEPSGATALLLAEHQEQLLAGIMVHHFGRGATYLYGASANDARKLMPNHALQWEAMRWASARGAAYYDLFGIAESEDPSEPLAGVTRFKAGWGGRVLRYAGGFDRVYQPSLYALVQRLRGRGME